jgi:hypothetical protein
MQSHSRPFRAAGQYNNRDFPAPEVLLIANTLTGGEEQVKRRFLGELQQFVSRSQPRAFAAITVRPGSSLARPRGVPWSKRMSIDGRRRGGGNWIRLEALSYKLEYGFDLLAGHVELVHDFLNAHVFEVLEDGGDWHTCILKYPRAANLTRDTFYRRAL